PDPRTVSFTVCSRVSSSNQRLVGPHNQPPQTLSVAMRPESRSGPSLRRYAEQDPQAHRLPSEDGWVLVRGGPPPGWWWPLRSARSGCSADLLLHRGSLGACRRTRGRVDGTPRSGG